MCILLVYSVFITATPHTHNNVTSLLPISYPCTLSSPVWLPAHLLTLSLSLNYFCYQLYPPVLTAELQKCHNQVSRVSTIIHMVKNLDWYIYYRLEIISFQFPSPSVVSEQGIILCKMYHCRPRSCWLYSYCSFKTLMCSTDYKSKHFQSQ